MPGFLYDLERDPVKAQTNLRQHGLDFERAATVFLDPLSLTIPDEEHSETEIRWITLGKDAMDRYLIVVHTLETLTTDRARIRLVLARWPTKAEVHSYEGQR